MKHKIITSTNQLPSKWPSVVGIDSETESVDWRRDRMIMFQICDGKTAYLIDLRVVPAEELRPLLEGPTLKIIHNSAFDCSWLRKEFGISTHNIWDTMLQEQTLLGMQLPRALKKADKELLKPQWSSSLEHCLGRRGWPNKFEFIPFEWGKEWTKEQIEYSVRDVEFLIPLMQYQELRLNELGQENVVHLENKVAEVTYQLSTNGIGVDKTKWMNYAKENEAVYNDIQEQLKEYADINWQAPGQACKYFGVRILAELEELKPDREEYHLWRKGRDIYKNVTTYGKKWGQTHIIDNRVYCQYNQIKNTGRFSADSPNLQQIPSTSKHRSFFIPNHFKGGSFVIADFKGQELAIMAHGSGEKAWLQTLRSGGDLHSVCAEMLLPDEWNSADEKGKKVIRQNVKSINFGIAYGLGVESYAAQTGLEEREASKLFSIYKSQFPKLNRWLYKNGQACVGTGETFSFQPFNRRRICGPLETESWRKMNIGKNNPVQATGADMTKLSMLFIDQKKKDNAIFVLQLHDELVMECKPGKEQWCLEMVTAAMNKACVKILGELLSKPEVRIAKDWRKV